MRAGTRRRWLIAAATLLAATVAFEAYARWPSSWQPDPLDLPPDTRRLVLLLHGTNGKDEPTLKAIARELSEHAAPGTVVRHYVWSPYSDNIFRAYAHGQQLGEALGRELAEVPALEQVHFVAHSAGSYVPDAACEAYHEARSDDHDDGARMDMTFLDPVGIAGTWDYFWGYRNYGRCADFAEAIINTTDAVPGSNAPLEHAHNVDVTELGADRDDGHVWPVHYYLQSVKRAASQRAARDHAQRPRGAVTMPAR